MASAEEQLANFNTNINSGSDSQFVDETRDRARLNLGIPLGVDVTDPNINLAIQKEANNILLAEQKKLNELQSQVAANKKATTESSSLSSKPADGKAVSNEEIKNPQEKNMRRSSSVINSEAMTKVESVIGDQHVVSETHSSGSSRVYSNQATSEFNPNNYQRKTNGDSFRQTVGYDGLHVGGDHEVRVTGDYIITTGVNEIYNEEDDKNPQIEYAKISGEVASIKASPLKATGGYSNNSKGAIPMKGQVDPESGSTQGQSPPPLMTNEDKQKMIEAKASKMAQSEVKMGTGGNVIINSGKHLIFGAGTTPAAFDSGFVNPVGRKVTNGMKYDSEKKALVEKFTAVPTFQERDTFSHMPFGNISFNGNTRITMNAGAGGVLMSGAGQMKILGTGLTHIAGQQLNLVGQGTTNIDTKALEVNAFTVTNVSSPETHVSGNVNIAGDLNVRGNLIVDGDILCTGNVQVNGNIHCDNKIEADVDVIAAGISLVNHVHGGVTGGGSKTAPPE